jgi:hypothetical protein
MSTYKSFKTSENLERDGIILDLGDVGKFRIARAGGRNVRYQKRLEALLRPHRRALQTETMSEEVAREVTIQAFSETVILGWDGVTGPDEQPLPFSVDNCKRLLSDLPDLFNEIRRFAENSSLFLDSIKEAEAKNSAIASSTP